MEPASEYEVLFICSWASPLVSLWEKGISALCVCVRVPYLHRIARQPSERTLGNRSSEAFRPLRSTVAYSGYFLLRGAQHHTKTHCSQGDISQSGQVPGLACVLDNLCVIYCIPVHSFPVSTLTPDLFGLYFLLRPNGAGSPPWNYGAKHTPWGDPHYILCWTTWEWLDTSQYTQELCGLWCNLKTCM